MHPDQDVDPPAEAKTRWFLVFLGIVGAILLFLALLRKPESPIGMRHPGVGERLESLSVEPFLNTEESITLADLNGKVTLINFWGPWCGPCMREMPELLALEKRYRDRKDVRFLLVTFPPPNSGESDAEELKEDSSGVLKGLKGDPPLFHDPQRRLIPELMRALSLNEFGFPTTVVLDGKGAVRGVWTGYHPSFVGDASQALERLLAEQGS